MSGKNSTCACLRTCLGSWNQQGQEHEVNNLQAGVELSLTILPQSSALLQLGKGALEDPALRYHCKGMQLITLG